MFMASTTCAGHPLLRNPPYTRQSGALHVGLTYSHNPGAPSSTKAHAYLFAFVVDDPQAFSMSAAGEEKAFGLFSTRSFLEE
jgi:hypothetical protein